MVESAVKGGSMYEKFSDRARKVMQLAKPQNDNEAEIMRLVAQNEKLRKVLTEIVTIGLSEIGKPCQCEIIAKLVS
jgi:hypothetical protein